MINFTWAQFDGDPAALIEDVGVSREALIAAHNGEAEAVNQVSTQLIEHIEGLQKGPVEKRGARNRRTVPVSVISRFAAQLLNQCAVRGAPPEKGLAKLIRVLLDVHNPHENYSKNRMGRIVGVFLIAENPDLPVREIARLCGVNQSSVSKWKKDPGFKKDVGSIQEFPGLRQNLDRWVGVNRDRPIR